MSRVYKSEFASWSDVLSSFGDGCPNDEPTKVFAAYETPSYDGYALVIVKNSDDQFDVIEGSHCSCYGLEGQWKPTRHDEVEIKKMLTAPYGIFNDQSEEISKWMKT